MCLHIGDVVEFVVTASDPLGANLQYFLGEGFGIKDNWKDFTVGLFVRSPREYHAKGHYDDVVYFEYEVLPPRV